MFKYYVYIESEVIVLPLVIYAETRETACKKAVKQFRRIFKKKKITRVNRSYKRSSSRYKCSM